MKNKGYTKIIQITDLHLCEDKTHVSFDINTFDSAKKMIEHIHESEADSDLIVISGDISDDGSESSYSHLTEIVSPIEIPFYLMPGNHDSVEKIREFSRHKNLNSKLYLEENPWFIFMFNTKKDDSPNGYLKNDEIEIFKKVLDENKEKYFMVFLHHHPVKIGSPSMDKMVIENAELLLDVIKNTESVHGVSWGHVHNVYETQLNNAQLFSTPSTCYQSKPRSETFIIDENEKPGYRVIKLLDSGELESQVVRLA